MTFYGLNTDDFIDEVRKYPEVWNVLSDMNRVISVKRKAWTNIAKAFIDNYDELSQEEKMEIDKKIHNKWRNVRDSYVRALKKNMGRKNIYGKKMSFLNEVYKVKLNDRNIDYEDDDSEQESEDEAANADKNASANKLIWSRPDEPRPEKITKQTDQRTNLDIEYIGVNSTDKTNDDDRLFFNSLLPITKEFDMDQKLKFRSEVLNIITRIRQDATNGEIKYEPDFDD